MPTQVRLRWRGTLLGGARFLHQAPRWSHDEMQAWQFARIQPLVRHAWTNVPFYRQLYTAASFRPDDLRSWADFQRLPGASWQLRERRHALRTIFV